MKKIKKTLSVTLLMLGLVSVGAGAGFVAKNAVVEPVAARAEIYPDWTCAVNKISATSDSTSSVIYGEVVDGAVDEIDEETLFTLHEGSGAGFALNGEAFTPVSVMAPANNVVRIDLGFEAQAGDVVTVSGAFSNADWEMTIEFNNCALQFDGSAWVAVGGSETPDVPEVNDNVSDLGAVASASGTNNQVYLAFASGVVLPIDSWDYAFSYVSGNGITVNGTMISMANSVKSVGNKFFVDLGAEAVEGDVLKIGGTFACESQGVQYVVEDSEFAWNGSAWVSTAEPETPPVQTYTTHDLGALALHVNSKPWGGAGKANNQLYLERADGGALPLQSWDYFFHVGEDGYFKLNDQVVTPNEIKSTDAGFFWLFNALNAGDTITIGGTFVCEDQFIKYTVAESKFTWTGENWEVYKEPVVYTTYNVNNLGIAGGCTADVVYAYVTDGDELPGGDWDNAFSFEAGSGAGMKLNGVEISGWEIKQPGDFYIKLSAAAVAGDTLTIDGAYYNEASAKRFVFNNCTITFNGTGWEAPSVEPEEPEVEYTTYNVNNLGIAGGCTADVVYAYVTDGDELPGGDWDNAFSFEVGSGAGMKLNGVEISGWEIKQPGDFYIKLSAAAVAGDTLTIDGAYYNEATAKRFVFDNCTVTFNGTGWEVPSVEPEEPDQPPVEGYTTHDLGALTLHVNSQPWGGAGTANNQLYLQRVDEEALPFMSWDFLFTVGEDGYFMVNDQVVTPLEIKSTDAGFFWLFAPLSAGDTITIGGTFVCEDKAIKYVVSESKFTWNGTNWEVYREPVVYTTYELGQVILLNADSTDNLVYFDPASGEKLPVTDDTWAEKLTFLAGSGVGITLNGVQINMDDIKIPNTMYVGLGTVVSAGDVLVIGGTFYNDNLAIKYVIEESAFTYDGETWISALEVARANAKQEIDTYLADFAQSDYYAAQWEEIITIVNTAKARIDVASESGLAAIVNQAKEDISKVETKEEVEVVLVTARNNAKMDLAGYKQEEDYKEAEWQVIQDAITAANAKINAATTEAEIQAAVAEAKAAIDAVKTAAELDAEQLKAWRDEAKATVQAYYDAIDFTKYSTEDNTKLAGYVATAMKAIEEETDKSKIDEIVAQFKANVDGVTGAEEDSGCGSVGVASGCLLGGLTMVAAAVALRKKKED